ncbi:hypothetical protein NKH18_32585 [Streptomyces sp. M10(2022)]
MSLLLRNARLLDVATGDYREADLRCADGRIVETGTGLTAPTTSGPSTWPAPPYCPA